MIKTSSMPCFVVLHTYEDLGTLSSLTLLFGQQDGHPARKNFCFKTRWDMALISVYRSNLPCGCDKFWPVLLECPG